MSETVGSVVTVVALAMVALVGVAVLAPVAGVVTDTAATNTDGSFSPLDTNRFVVSDNEGLDETTITVRATRGNAVSLDGQGYVNATPPANWSDGSWSVAAVADPDTSADSWFDQAATHNVVAAGNGALRVDWDRGSWAAYYEDPNSSDSAIVRVPATADQTPIVVTHNETTAELTISADGNTSSASLTAATATRNVSLNWAGMIDEVRYFRGDLTTQQVAAYQSDPITALPAADHLARWQFDAGRGDTAPGFYAAPTAELVVAGWTSDGVDGPQLDRGDDYELEAEPIAVTVVDGGYLDGAPIAYVKAVGPLGQVLTSIVGGFDSAFSLLPVVLLGLIASVAITTVQRMRTQG